MCAEAEAEALKRRVMAARKRRARENTKGNARQRRQLVNGEYIPVPSPEGAPNMGAPSWNESRRIPDLGSSWMVGGTNARGS
jgi:hypothetical protein